MNKVYSLIEAQEWFVLNTEGKVTCVKGDREKECETYPEARRFFEGEAQTPDRREEEEGDGLSISTPSVTMAEDPEPSPDPEPTPETPELEPGGGEFGGAGGGSSW